MLSSRVGTCTWTEVERFYERLVSDSAWPFVPMLELVRFIASSTYANGLFPATSHEVLLIGRVANFVRHDNELQVAFNAAAQTFSFTYSQRPDETDPWSRSCGVAEGRATFERLLHKRLRWFHEG
ncbi:hypothetical protein [Polaromonas sp. P5_D5]